MFNKNYQIVGHPNEQSKYFVSSLILKMVGYQSQTLFLTVKTLISNVCITLIKKANVSNVKNGCMHERDLVKLSTFQLWM